ncbi:hypothetical protein CJF42_23485 [Pseudoalteromonas sp. NBT06-2]|uniref:tyrosine-type recombinase/integrase n=1 Tax=Pseudoalteromonas sp. NBT06-2 TaxID=2025950 RepID=UPI000BA6AD58|nr:tyrosine-type recombinase/integrase [Pseudoalteromonas sp. NBT06-2]PAJ72017.1 hypothetical protein CJF42_23485 [Pseudoalteromonas sp. NBT06-2]
MEQFNPTDSFFDLLDAYETHCLAEGQSMNTVKTKRCNLRMFIKWCFANGVKRPLAVTKAVGEQYKSYLASYINPRSGELLRKSTRRRRVTDVRVFYRELTYLEIIESNPLELLRLPKAQKSLPTSFLSFDELECVFNETTIYGIIGLRDRAMLELYYGSGARRMEIAKLDVNNVNFTKREIFISDGKGDKDRYVPIAKRTCDWLKAYIIIARPKLLKLDSGMSLFIDNQGKRFRATQLSDLVKKYLLKAGYDVGFDNRPRFKHSICGIKICSV